MASWSEVERAAPGLADAVKARFEAYGLGLLATVRRDGSPRISGIEPLFGGELWLGMMSGSLKARDLQRDPRFALHSATTNKEVRDGDAKIAGRAHELTDDPALAAFRTAFQAKTGYPVPDGPFQLFRADVIEMSTLRPDGDHLNIDSWREGQPVKRVERR